MKWLKIALWINITMTILFVIITIAARVAPGYWPRPLIDEERNSRIQTQVETSSDAEYLKKMALAALAERNVIEKYSFLVFSAAFKLVSNFSLLAACFSAAGISVLLEYRKSLNTAVHQSTVSIPARKQARRKRIRR